MRKKAKKKTPTPNQELNAIKCLPGYAPPVSVHLHINVHASSCTTTCVTVKMWYGHASHNGNPCSEQWAYESLSKDWWPSTNTGTQSNLLPLHTWVLHAVAVCRRDPASRYDPSQNMGTMATKTLVRHPWNASAEVSAFAPDFPAIFFCTFVALAGTLGPLCHYASDSSPRKSSSSLIRAAWSDRCCPESKASEGESPAAQVAEK